MDAAVDAVVDFLGKKSSKVRSNNEIEQVATIAANSDEKIGSKLAEAFERVGRDGVITIEEGSSLDTEITWVEGMQFDKGYLSPYFVTDSNTMEAVLEDAYVLVFEKKITNLNIQQISGNYYTV